MYLKYVIKIIYLILDTSDTPVNAMIVYEVSHQYQIPYFKKKNCYKDSLLDPVNALPKYLDLFVTEIIKILIEKRNKRIVPQHKSEVVYISNHAKEIS